MPRNRRKTTPKPQRPWRRWLPLALAYAFCLLCLVAGILVLIYGGQEPSADREANPNAVTQVGIGLLALGLLAGGLTAYLHRAAIRRK